LVESSGNRTAKTARRDFLKAAAGALATAPLVSRALRAAPAQSETILVAGAGLAGLVAAYRLHEAGKRVILIEARDAPGGRVRTVRGMFDDGLYGELGAARIAETHEYVLHWVNDLRLTLTPFAPASGSAILAVGGKRARVDVAAAHESLAPGLKPGERELSVPGLLLKYIAGVPDELGAGDVNLADPRWRDFDRVTWPAWLASRGASPAAIRLMMLGGDSSQFSALFMLQQIMLHRESRQYFKIEGGMDRLPRGIAAALHVPVRHNCRLMKLDRTGKGIRAQCITGGHSEEIAADRAVLAIPFSMLRKVVWDPRLSPEKTRMMSALTYFDASRFLLQTGTRFWAAAGLNGSARTDGPADIWDMSFGQKGAAGLVSLTTGDDRIENQLEKMPPAQQTAFGAGLAAEAFPEIKSELRKSNVQIWGLDPFAGGAFSVFKPGQMTAWAGILGKPEAGVHFAGEHLSPWNGWMEGALWSGERAAQEIIQA
jgi:monoamine oxidase